MTRPPCPHSARQVWAFLVLATATLVSLAWLTGSSRRPPAETIGFAEFRPPPPSGHPSGVTVRLNLPRGFRAQVARDHRDVEAGVANSRGEPQFYVLVRFVPVAPSRDGETLLGTFARQEQSVDRPERRRASCEFRAGARGPIWLQRYAEAVRETDLARAESGGLHNQGGQMDVLRYAEEWDGLLLELEFNLRPGRGTESEPLVWDIVRGMEVTGRVAGR